MKAPVRKVCVTLLILVSMLAASCGGGVTPCDNCDEGEKSLPFDLTEVNDLLAKKKYSQAENECLKLEEKFPEYPEPKYCVLLANVGELVNSTSAIISLVASRMSPQVPYRQSGGLDIKQILATVVADIEQQMSNIDGYAYKLAGMESPTYQLPDFPLGLDVRDLMSIVGSTGYSVDDNLTVNLKGTWDQSEVVLLGAVVNGVQAVLDYLLAHKLKLDAVPNGVTLSSQFVARFLIDNPNLLVLDERDKDRLEGGDSQKGLKNDVLAALSYLIGRDTELERVSPAHGGFRAAVKQSVTNAAEDAVIKWVDDDDNGIPETVTLRALDDLKDKILDPEGERVIETSTFQMPLEAATWEALYAKGDEVIGSIEAGGGKAVAVQEVVETIRQDALGYSESVSNFRLAGMTVPKAVAVDLGAFLSAPMVVADLVPYYFEYKRNGTTMYDIAFEEEMRSYNSFYVSRLGLDWSSWDAPEHLNGDFGHFAYDQYAVVVGGYTFSGIVMHSNEKTMTGIRPDGLTATAKVPFLHYLGLQSPSLGGLLHVSPELNGQYAKATQASLNKTIANIELYYCIDVLVNGYLFEANYPLSNKIADCGMGL